MVILKRATAFIISLVVMTSCLVSQPQVEDRKPPGEWRYEIELTNPGTRSEGKVGHLYYGAREIGPYFQLIVIDNNRYEYRIAKQLWEFRGYEKTAGSIPQGKSGASALSAAERAQGWYRAAFNAKRNATPVYWIWISRDGLEAYVDPGKLAELIQHYGLKPLQSAVNSSQPGRQLPPKP